MSYIGTTEIVKMFLGSVEIDKAYLGDELVFSSAPVPQQYTITVNPSSYDTVNSAYHSWTNAATNAYTDTSSSTEARARLTSGANAETKVYWQFDLSTIPSGATITSIELKVKCKISAVSSSYIQSQYVVVCNGTTEVDTQQAMTNSITIYTLNAGSGWTRDSIQNLTILQYARRASSNTSSAYYIGCSGADLTVTYTV